MGSNTVAKCWLHIIISTHEEEKLFSHKEVAVKLRNFLFHFGEMNDIKIKSCSAVGEHLHMLVDLQLHYSIDELVTKIRNAAAAWLNEQNFFEKDFSWEKSYGAFSVSPSNIQKVVEYINDQEDHHRTESFEEEYQHFVEAYGIY
jgi:REP element-mobilizing transposase RayT